MQELANAAADKQIAVLNELRTALATISTPEEAMNVRDRAAKMRDAFKIMNRSVEDCNQFAEIYLLATWGFGDLVKDIGKGAPEGNANAKRK